MSLARTLLPGLIIVLIPMQVFAWNWRTKISLSLNNQPLSAACELIEKEYGIHFSYSRDVVSMTRRVSVNVKDMPLRRVLDLLFDDSNIQYKRIGDQLVLAFKHAATRTINGFVEDALTGEKLIGATVYMPHLHTGTTTNQYGFFSLTTAKDTGTLHVSYIGYNAGAAQLKDKENRLVNIKLSPSNTLQEVEVTDNLPKLQEQTQMSKLNLAISQTKTMPRMLGEADVLRTIQAMPGVSGGADGSSGIHVRGGSPDQNLILLDGTPVYNATHAFGIFSVFNPDMVKNVELYKGAFPARYGGRLSSVVDISMKDGDMYEYHGEISLGLLASKFMVEGPIDKGKTSFIVTARRTYADLILQDVAHKQFNLGEEGEFWLYFFDGNAKINHIFSPKDRVYLSAYGGKDHLTVDRNHQFDSINGTPKRYHEEMRFRLGWGNQAYALRWNHIFSPRLFSNTTLNYSQFYFNTDYQYKYTAIDTPLRESDNMKGRYFSKVQNTGGKIDFDYRPNPEHAVRFGLQATYNIFQPGILRFNNVSDDRQLIDTSFNDETSGGLELAVYAEDDWKIGNSVHLNLGLHASSFIVPGRVYGSLQPRMGFRILLPQRWALKMSHTVMTQYLHLLTNSATYMPTDLWVAATDKVPPMHANQVALGLAKTTQTGMYEMSVEGHYKEMKNVIEYNELSNDFQSATPSWENNVVIGRGWSYGGEVMLQKKKGDFRGWIGYTLAWADRQFPTVNQGKKFPYKYDRRHDVEIVLTQRLGKRWELSAQWQYSTGAPLSLPVGSYEQQEEPSPHTPGGGPPNEIDIVGNRNMLRMQDVHRLDIGATHVKQRKKTRYTLNISLYNTYNQKNPFFYYYKRDDAGKRELTMLSILPILPSVTYAIRF